MRALREEQAYDKARARHDAERRRARTQRRVQEMLDSTPAARINAAKARAGAVHAGIDEIVSQADLNASSMTTDVKVEGVRIDDLEMLFAVRERLPKRLRQRIETIYAKINWKDRHGGPGYFNVAVHKNDIPIDKALSILAHIEVFHDGSGHIVTPSVDNIIECGLFSRIKRGKFEYGRRCQDGDHCDLCNYLNVSDGLKTLYASYDRSAFRRGGNWFAITVAPRTNQADAVAIGRALVEEDWRFDNDESLVYRESRCGRAFPYTDTEDEDPDWEVETKIRGFLGAVQYVFGKLVKNCWLDGIRARMENSVEFLPYASHQHWHAVGSSTTEHEPQKMAEFIKEEVDAILVQTCPDVYADVLVAVLPAPKDLRGWIKYMNKTTNLITAVESVYNRYPDLGRSGELYATFMQQLNWFSERSRRVFGMCRHTINNDERGRHTYTLRKRYVRGTHKFGKGSILTEPDRHRLWREQHAQKEAERRAERAAAIGKITATRDRQPRKKSNDETRRKAQLPYTKTMP